MLRLVNDGDTVEKIAVNFGDDTKFISEVVDFLIDIKWLKQDENGEYKIMGNGKTYTINRRRAIAKFTTPDDKIDK